ncbi:MAG: ACT domain-containing protein [Bacteroidota bacterium]
MKNTNSGITDLQMLIQNMEPVLNDGAYVFVTLKDADKIPRSLTIAEFKEAEGTTLVLRKEDAERLNLTYDFVAAWITLNVHSALEAVGLTAAFATELGKHHISCNVWAGYYHDHIFVDIEDGQKALEVLKAMRFKTIAL